MNRNWITAGLVSLLAFGHWCTYAAGQEGPEPAVQPALPELMKREVSREGIEYLQKLRKRTPFGTNDFKLEALRAGTIAGAGLDVFAVEPLPAGHPLREAPNVVMTPHSAGVTPEALLAGLELAAENVADFLAGQAQSRYVVAGPGR